jgi:hypothetical protein
VDINNIDFPQPKTKKDRAKKLSEDIVTMVYISNAIKGSFLGGDLEDSTDKLGARECSQDAKQEVAGGTEKSWKSWKHAAHRRI